jgi:hypothetical protein
VKGVRGEIEGQEKETSKSPLPAPLPAVQIQGEVGGKGRRCVGLIVGGGGGEHGKRRWRKD